MDEKNEVDCGASIEQLRKALAEQIESLINNPDIPESVKNILRKGKNRAAGVNGLK